MATVVTVTDHAYLVEFRAVIALGCPLPRILTAVSEENVGSGCVKATLVDGRLVGLGIIGHVKATESVRAHLREVLLVNNGAPHGFFGAHGLEPTILSAVLEGPRTTTAVNINLSAC